MCDRHASEVLFSDHLQLHIIELPKFRRSVSELEARLDRWCFFLRNAVELEVDQLPEALQTEPIKRAVEVLRVMSLNTLEEQLYEARLREQRDKSSSLKGAYLDGRDAGIQEGKSIGVQEGLIKAIVLLLKVRFPDEANSLSKLLERITDAEKLESILGQISTATDATAVRQILE
jgi:predicted transposase/invertase (TIGR01784 family)